MNVFDLFAKLSLDSSEYDSGLDKAEKKGGKFGSGLKKAAGIAAGAIAATTGATVAAGKAFVEGASKVAQMGDAIDKNSQKVGLSKKAYQEFDYVLNIAGTSMDNMGVGLKTLTNKVAAAEGGNKKAVESFKKLGISVDDLKSMSREDLFAATIKGLQNMEDGVDRAALANTLLGKSGQELTPLFNMTNQEMDDLIQKANEYGMVMSDDAVSASANFQDSLTTMQNSIDGMKNRLMADFLPAFTTTMDGLSKIFSGTDVEGGLADIENGINGLASELVNKAPQVMQIGGTIIKALLTSISDNIGTLLDAAVPIVMEIATGIIEVAPKLLDAVGTVVSTIAKSLSDPKTLTSLLNAGTNIILSIGKSLAQGASKIAPTLATVIKTIATVLTNPETMSTMLSVGLDIIMGLINGILDAIPTLISMLPTVIQNICTFLISAIPMIMDAAVELFDGIIEALPVIIDALSVALPQVIDMICNLLIEGLPLILAGAEKMFSAIISAIPIIIEQLVVRLPDIISSIVGLLIKNIPTIVSAAVQLLMGIVGAIPQIIEALIPQIPTIISSIVNGLLEGTGQILAVGGQLLSGLWNGITNKMGWLMDKIKSLGGTILNGIKNVFSVHSPSKKTAEIGKFLALGLGEGFDSKIKDVAKDMAKNASGVTDSLSDAMSVNSAINASMSASTMKATGGFNTGSSSAMIEELGKFIDTKLSNVEFNVPVYIGQSKIEQQVVTAQAHRNAIAGGR